MEITYRPAITRTVNKVCSQLFASTELTLRTTRTGIFVALFSKWRALLRRLGHVLGATHPRPYDIGRFLAQEFLSSLDGRGFAFPPEPRRQGPRGQERRQRDRVDYRTTPRLHSPAELRGSQVAKGRCTRNAG